MKVKFWFGNSAGEVVEVIDTSYFKLTDEQWRGMTPAERSEVVRDWGLNLCDWGWEEDSHE